MSAVSKNKLKARAQLLSTIRDFFEHRDVLEVETPLLGHAPASDPFLEAFTTTFHHPAGIVPEKLYLQTSPEYAMKRLLSEGSGAIYQICKAFRNGEGSKKHNPEFTLLEWYRPGFTHHHLMDEMELLFHELVKEFPEAPTLHSTERLTYESLFLKFLDLNPLEAQAPEIKAVAEQHGLTIVDSNHSLTKDDWLMLLMDHLIEPQLDQLTFVYDYPAGQSALAKLNPQDSRTAERFEVYWRGIELANGFHELNCPQEQQQRFEQDNVRRQALGLREVPLDENLLQALTRGIPDCSGVALGLDRLLMILTKRSSIQDVLAYSVEQA